MERETLLRRLAAVLSVGAAVIHGVVIRPHFEEHVSFGVFFVAVTVFQALWAVVALTRSSKVLYWIGILGNAAIIATWAWSRTAGIPIGPEPGVAEAPGVRDGLSVAFEAILVVLCIAARSRWSRGAVERGRSFVTTVAAVVVVATLTAIAVASPEDEGNGVASNSQCSLPLTVADGCSPPGARL